MSVPSPVESPRQQYLLGLVLAVLVLALSSQGQTYQTIARFSGTTGIEPLAPVTIDSLGNIYGTTELTKGGYGSVYELTSTGKIKTLYAFSGNLDGGNVNSPVVRDSAGNLFGTAWNGGFRNGTNCQPGCGVLFKIDSAGNFVPWHLFSGVSDGAFPTGGLVADSSGNLYGVANGGGIYNSTCDQFSLAGCGVVFKFDSEGSETVVYSFTGASDGWSPFGGLLLDSAGSLYGTTEFGGIVNSSCAALVIPGCGVIFKIDTAGAYSVLYSFTGGTDGSHPTSTLVSDSEGNLYGSSYYSGDTSCLYQGCGTVFKLDTSGVLTTLHTFTGKSDGALPNGLLTDQSGNLYGTTTYGGDTSVCLNKFQPGCGTVFKIDTAGNETVLYNFQGPKHHDGFYPMAGLTADKAGNLYGTTAGSAPHISGTVFKVVP